MVQTRFSSARIENLASRDNNLTTLHKARDIIVDNFPQCLIVPNFHVTSTAIHRLKFMGALQHWSTFKLDARRQFNAIDWQDHTAYLDATLVDSATNGHNVRNEHYRCGEEIISNGRYVNHVLHILSAIALEIGFPVQYGDWNSCTERGSGNSHNTGQKRGLVPDFVLMGPRSIPLIVGEGKTPFPKHQFEEWVQSAVLRGDSSSLRVLLGQIAQYMHNFSLRFAFVTNYDTTIFLQQKVVNGVETILFSDPIRREDKSVFGSGLMGSSPQISVREAMLYLVAMASTGPRKRTFKNKTKAEDWVEPLRLARTNGAGARRTSIRGG